MLSAKKINEVIMGVGGIGGLGGLGGVYGTGAPMDQPHWTDGFGLKEAREKLENEAHDHPNLTDLENACGDLRLKILDLENNPGLTSVQRQKLKSSVDNLNQAFRRLDHRPSSDSFINSAISFIKSALGDL